VLPTVIAVCVFAFWWLVGLAGLTALRVSTSEARNALAAPVVGSAFTVIPLFLLSYAGLSMHAAAPFVAAGIGAASVVVLVRLRPQVHKVAIPVALICLAEVGLVARPFFEFGFHWYANANDDMANYVLSATELVGHGLLTPVNWAAVAHDRGFPSTLNALHIAGSRPGADITLASVASVTGRPANQLFMVTIVAFQMLAVCGTAAFTMSATRRVWAGVLAAGLFALSPVAAFGMLQQLLPQQWAIALAAVLFAFLLSRRLHSESPPAGEVAVIGLLAAAVTVVYVELASTLIVAYGLYLLVLALRREIAVKRVATRLWLPGILLIVVLLNGYLWTEISYVRHQAASGFSGSGGTRGPDIFGYSLVPAALPGFLGLQVQNPSTLAPHLALSIIASILIIAIVIAGSAIALRRANPVAAVAIAYAIVGFALAVSGADFGMYKLFMYVQPFLIAVVASWFGRAPRRWAAAAAVPLVVIVVAQISTQAVYVHRSRHPIDLRQVSSSELLPTFRQDFAASQRPVVTITDNPTLAKLEASMVGSRPLYLISSNIFGSFVNGARRSLHQRNDAVAAVIAGWTRRTFDVRPGVTDRFDENTRAQALIARHRCNVIAPSGSLLALNRYVYPEGEPALLDRRCGDLSNFLVFTNSTLGNGFYSAFLHRRDVTFYQLEHDTAFPAATFSGVGRYILFRVLDPSPTFRVMLTLTEAPLTPNTLPPAAIIGARRYSLHLVGSGSARVVSDPIKPRMIGGAAYILLDLGRDGRLVPRHVSGIQGLYGRSEVIDFRYLTSFLRDMSLLSKSQYANLRPPRALTTIPADLGNPNLQFSGITDDGWMAHRALVTLAGGDATDLRLRVMALPIPDQRLTISVNGRVVATPAVEPGDLSVDTPLPASRGPRRIVLSWRATERLSKQDARVMAAHLSSIGLGPSAGSASG
jgi:hypothetical protein